jgi:hypothetical protein
MKSGAAACLLLAAFAAACETRTLTAVGAPSGVYQPGEGCTLAQTGSACPPPGAAFPQLRFESTSDAADLTVTTPSTTDLAVTCARSYCGTGSLSAHADLAWDDSISNDPRRFATFVRTFDPPLDLYGKTVSFAVSVEGPSVPMNAQVGVVSDYWHWVGWSVVADGWTHIAGVVSPDNPLTKLDAAATTVPVQTIQIDVYVPMAAASGAMGAWSGTIYLDDVGWQ